MTATPMRPEPRLQHETRCLVRADGVSTEHRTLLGAMKAARALVEAGHRGVAVVDRRAAIAWRADRLGLTPMLDLDRECMFAAQQSAVSDSGGRA